MKDFKPLLKNNKFIFLWISQIFSQLTINIMNFVLLVRIIAITNSAIAASLLWIAYALPAILIGPFAAAASDMFERRRVLMLSNLFQSVVVFLYALSHNERFFLLFGLVFAYSLLNQFYIPTEHASLPSIVSKKYLPFANSLFFLTQQSAIVLGFGLGGLILSHLRFTNSLYLCSFFLFMAFISVSLLPKLSNTKKFARNIEAGLVIFFKRISEGYNFIKEHNSILFPFLLLIGMQVGMAIVAVNVPIFAREILGLSIISAGLGVVVPAGVGAVVGAIAISKLLKNGIRKKKIIETSLFVLGLTAFCLVWILDKLPMLSKSVVGSMLLFLIGAAFLGVVIPSQTYLQEATPGGLRGRVFGNFWFLTTIATVVPILFSATLTEVFGIRFLIFMISLTLFAVFYVAKKFGITVLFKGYLIK